MDIENPILFFKNLEVNESIEIKQVGKCEFCKEDIYSDSEYLLTDFEEILCGDYCYVQHMARDGYVKRINN